jgi:hypothetical protein
MKHKNPRTEEHRKKLSESQTGVKSHHWKGDTASYSAMHRWVRRWKGSADHCEVCGVEGKKKYEWANIDHKYKRIFDDYIPMCTSCHIKYDKERKANISNI